MNYNDTLAIDMLAQNTIKSYDPELLKGELDEIPIEEIIEFTIGLRLIYANLSKNKSILGMTIFEDCAVPVYNLKTGNYESILVIKGTIIIDISLLENGYEKKLKFTLAHELAHWLVHYNYYYNSNEIANKTSGKSVNKTVEQEADLLALSLLLPRGRIKVAYDRTKFKFKKEATIQIIADTFNVSKEDVLLRLTNLNLVSK